MFETMIERINRLNQVSSIEIIGGSSEMIFFDRYELVLVGLGYGRYHLDGHAVSRRQVLLLSNFWADESLLRMPVWL
jgi:hypothetical protein